MDRDVCPSSSELRGTPSNSWCYVLALGSLMYTYNDCHTVQKTPFTIKVITNVTACLRCGLKSRRYDLHATRQEILFLFSDKSNLLGDKETSSFTRTYTTSALEESSFGLILWCKKAKKWYTTATTISLEQTKSNL
jgi:hypothetical protein